MMRTCALRKQPSLTAKKDIYLKGSLQFILKLSLNDTQWTQAVLPISKGALGIRKITYVCLPAFLSSASLN